MAERHNRRKWLEAGYRVFAEKGPDHISVNSLSHEVGVSRTSFYHHFGSVDEFIECLLEYHVEKGTQYLDRLRKCESYEPDFIELIVAEREAFLFHRRLILNRQEDRYSVCAHEIDKTTLDRTFRLWTKKHGLEELGQTGVELFAALSEAWWTRVGPDSFEYETLKRIDDEITSDLLRVLGGARPEKSIETWPRLRIVRQN
jgi:AcrR family transcriptional regulator